MTLYFVARKDDPYMVKIGTTEDMERRMRTLAVSGPIVLFATCYGGRVEERFFLNRFADLRIEGEWFRANEEMISFIRYAAEPCHVEYGKSETRWSLRKPDNRRELDAFVLGKLMRMIIATYPRNVTVSMAHERIYAALSEMGDGWTRRRVRALYEQRAHRVDAYELIDLLRLSGMPETEWVRWLTTDAYDLASEAAE